MWQQEKSERHAKQPQRPKSTSRSGRNISSLEFVYLELKTESDAFGEREI